VEDKALEDLQSLRKVVAEDIDALYDTLETEMYLDTIKELREHVTLLESELDKYRELLQDEMKNAQFYKKGFQFMQRVKTITVR
jgi:archaellum component FlaC